MWTVALVQRCSMFTGCMHAGAHTTCAHPPPSANCDLRSLCQGLPRTRIQYIFHSSRSKQAISCFPYEKQLIACFSISNLCSVEMLVAVICCLDVMVCGTAQFELAKLAKLPQSTSAAAPQRTVWTTCHRLQTSLVTSMGVG